MLLDMRAWLESEGFGDLADLFELRQVDADALPLLTDAHLHELGLPLGRRVKLLAAIGRLAGGAAPSAERRRLTVVFVDLVGSTALSARLDPEELRELIRDYQRAITAEVARYEGHVARYMGDGALVYFGYPKAHEDDAERAVRAALAIVRAVAAQRAPGGEPLAAHIGIATGLVVVGDVLGAGAATERAVLGETPNLAARLQQLAGPGQIVVSAQTRALTGGLFEWRDLGPQEMKGVPGPVVAYSLASERPVQTRFEARGGGPLTAMVGRDAQLAILLQRWREAEQGHGQIVVLTGEAGIGKSRILRALEAALAGEPHLRITNQCSPYHTGSALHPMIQQLTRASGIDPASTPAEQLDRLEALLRGAEKREVALMASLLGIDGATRYGRLDLSPEQQRARTFEALVNQLVRAGMRTPVLWVLEDAHWADPTTLELLTFCVERITGARMLAVVTARPEFAPDFGERPHVSRLTLGRLDREAVAAMVGHLGRGKSLPEPLLSEIAAKADGVPLFVEELTKAVLEAGVLQETGSAYVFGDVPRPLSVPASLHDSMMARLDRHAALKEVAQTAACIGREFSQELLSAICGMPEDALSEGLARLEQAELVFRRRAEHGRHYVFKHALVRDAAYESLLKSRRQQIHARIVAALEGAPAARPEVLAQHAAEAGLIEKAIDYWQKAGAVAIARPAYQEAISHINQALRLAEKMADDPSWLDRRLQLLLLLGQATIPLRGYSHSETVSVFTRAQELAAKIGEGPKNFSVASAMWVAYYVRGEHAKAIAVAQDMHRRAKREQSGGRLLTALRALGISQMIAGELVAARSTFEDAEKLAYLLREKSREHRIVIAERFAADPDIATQFHVALTRWALGDVEAARQLAEQAVAAARVMGHVHTLGHALAHGAIFAAVMRDAGAAHRLSGETIAFADEHDMDLWRAYGLALQGYACVLGGDAGRAVPLMARAFRLFERTETGTMLPAFHAVNACALATEGQFDAAAREAALVQRELTAGSERYFWAESLRWIGDYRSLMPDMRPSEVEQAYAEALSVARQQRAKSLELGAATSLARFRAARGGADKAIALLAPLHAAFEDGLDTPVVREAAELVRSLRAGEIPVARHSSHFA